MPLPLEGVRVVDFSRVLAGPHCGKTLLDLGAQVIKIEPPAGDLSRRAFPGHGEISGYYAQQNAGKRNVSIDLNVPGSREIALRLCGDADVIIENFRPGALAAFRLDYETISAANPRVVYASISGYGQHGPWRSRSAYAPTVQAETGITATTAEHFDRAGLLRSDALSHADVYSGLHAAIAILSCLTERARTGKGRYIDVAMAAVMLSVNERVHVDLSDEELGAERPILGATDGPFFTGPHGERFASPMSLVGSMSFPFYLAAMRRPDLGRDPRFATPELRLRNLPALHRIVQDWIATFGDMAALDAQLDEAKIATGQVRTTKATSIATACAYKLRTKVVLYWRPIVPGWNDQPQTMAHVLATGQEADAIVFTGYYHKPQNAGYLRSLGVEIPYDEQHYHRRKTLPADLDAKVVTAWHSSGITTPLFRKTSCGVSAAHNTADYNGHWGVRELCDICPAHQISRCRAAHRTPQPAEFEAVLDDLGYSSDYLIEEGHAWTHGLGEQRRYAIQHTLGFQIWELDQPHLLHAHGRSLTGYHPTGTEQHHLAKIRDRFTQAARFDEDD